MTNAEQSAYPLSETVHTGFGPTHEKIFSTVHSGGLTKREYFAAHAMQGLLSNPQYVSELMSMDAIKDKNAMLALEACDMADELLKQLENNLK